MRLREHLGSYQRDFEEALSSLLAEQVVERIWKRDHTLWKPEPEEISNRLGWLTCHREIRRTLPEIEEFADDVQCDGFSHIVLIGMGGSSLAPEVFLKVYGVKKGYPEFNVLDSIDPDVIQDLIRQLEFKRTLFVVSSKSGTTLETISLFKFFFTELSKSVGREHPGDHFAAITDKGSPLDSLAQEFKFRKIFHPDPNIGGRYAALSHIGLVPAALMGLDMREVLDRADTMAELCGHADTSNPAARLGALMGEMATEGKDKLTIFAAHPVKPFGCWLEQLVAESTGKEGKGILPVIGERVLEPELYANDRLFVDISLAGDKSREDLFKALRQAGHPVVQLMVQDKYDLGAQFFLWEMATAIACWQLDVNPFDQPNVEDAKARAREMMTQFLETRKFNDALPIINADAESEVIKRVFEDLISSGVVNNNQGSLQSYVALQAYLPPTPLIDRALQKLRLQIESSYKIATTTGYGPRFLHSTGQLHKGDAGHGRFVQFISDSHSDVGIPNEPGLTGTSFTFGQLQRATALGDREALQSAQRKVITVHLGHDIVTGISRLAAVLE